MGNESLEIRDDLPPECVIQIVVPDPSDTDLVSRTLAAYMLRQPLPEGTDVFLETFEEYAARGRVADCDCGLIQCVCSRARPHAKDCRFRKALTCAIPIACEEHGLDVCPTCDLCSCGTGATP